jgi:hypothetical protein
MTTVMLVAAMVPMAMGKGPGAASRAGMAKVIIGGQALSLLLTLLVTPVAYSLWDDWTQFWKRLFRRQPRIALIEPAIHPAVHPVATASKPTTSEALSAPKFHGDMQPLSAHRARQA